MGTGAQAALFGQRKEAHTVIIARGDRIRHFTLRPWAATAVLATASAIMMGYLGATAYLVFRDDLIEAAVVNRSRLQQEYEDRLSLLRTQVDRITSQQILDQQSMERKVAKLAEQQSLLAQRHGRIAPPQTAPLAVPAPTVTESAPSPAEKLSDAFSLRSSGHPAESLAFDGDAARSLPAETGLAAIDQSLRDIEAVQLAKLDALTNSAFRTADGITTALADAGLARTPAGGEGGLGGPFIPASQADPFDTKVRELDAALDKLDAAKAQARRLPLGEPAPGQPVSSTFGVRADPLLGTPALHSGIDFRAPVGMAARAAAPGIVTKAGWNGGYGQMVEIDHGRGVSTRYAHLSRIDVREGQTVGVGAAVGEVGSTGRSTGPHLHYEVRQNGEAVDPARFLQAGRKVSRLMADG